MFYCKINEKRILDFRKEDFNLNKLYIVVPAYNEAENIERFINDWYPIIERYNLETGGGNRAF